MRNSTPKLCCQGLVPRPGVNNRLRTFLCQGSSEKVTLGLLRVVLPCVMSTTYRLLTLVVVSWVSCSPLFLSFLRKKTYFWQIYRNNPSIVLPTIWCWGLAPFLGHTCNRKLWQSTAGRQCHTASCRADFGWYVLNLDTSLFLLLGEWLLWLCQTLIGSHGFFISILTVWYLGVKLSKV